MIEKKRGKVLDGMLDPGLGRGTRQEIKNRLNVRRSHGYSLVQTAPATDERILDATLADTSLVLCGAGVHFNIRPNALQPANTLIFGCQSAMSQLPVLLD